MLRIACPDTNPGYEPRCSSKALNARHARSSLSGRSSRRAPFLAGHSLGGQIAIVAAAQHGARLAGVVEVDAPVHSPDPESGALARAVRPVAVYPGLAAAMARFRLLPQQPCPHVALFGCIARHSMRQVAGGWRRKFDPLVLARPRQPTLAESLPRGTCALAMVRGEHSAVLIDQPLAFVSALRALLAAWRHPSPLPAVRRP